MFSKQSFFEAILESSLGMPDFDRCICTDIHIKLSEKSIRALAIDGTAELSGVIVANCSALPRMGHSHALPRMDVADQL